MPNPKGKHLMNGSETNKGQGFANNPQNIHRGGRPKKLVSGIIDELQAMGYEKPTPQHIKDTYLILSALPIYELKRLANDTETPALFKVVSKAMISGKGFEVLEKMFDRSIGKAEQHIELQATVTNNPLEQRLKDLGL